MDVSKLTEVSNFNSKPVIKLNTLTVNQPYVVKSLNIVKTKFGEVVKAELEKNIVFLPQRVTEAFKKNVEKFEPGKYAITFKTMKTIDGLNPTPIFDFVKV
ncbi:hypothetical protein ABEB36_015654 [Hypothenemus hampei]|uniref:Uncharacterized protein n=1 Tax=Hypothenemus hampei TaxID=57062 RepID=A0ABD1DZ49_HYPHA